MLVIPVELVAEADDAYYAATVRMPGLYDGTDPDRVRFLTDYAADHALWAARAVVDEDDRMARAHAIRFRACQIAAHVGRIHGLAATEDHR